MSKQEEQAVALLSAILHRLEARGVAFTVTENYLWSLATDLLQGGKPIPEKQLDTLTDLKDIPTT